MNKMIEKLDIALFSNGYTVFGDLNSNFVTFFSNDLGLNSIFLDNINLDDNCTVCSCQVTYEFQTESTLYICL